MSVVATFKLQDHRSACEASGEPQRCHGAFSSGVGQTDLFNRRERLANEFRQLNLAFRWSAVTGARFQYLGQSLHHFWMAVSQNQRSPRTNVVDVLIAVDVEQMRSSAFGDEQGIPT